MEYSKRKYTPRNGMHTIPLKRFGDKRELDGYIYYGRRHDNPDKGKFCSPEYFEKYKKGIKVRARRKYDYIAKLVNDYKWLAKETDAVVVLASQLNRFVERANIRGKALVPQLSDLAESGAIEQVAENVFFSYYDYKVTGEKGKGKNVITLIASKVRYGDSGSSDLGYDGNKCKIYNTMEEILNEEHIPF